MDRLDDFTHRLKLYSITVGAIRTSGKCCLIANISVFTLEDFVHDSKVRTM